MNTEVLQIHAFGAITVLDEPADRYLALKVMMMPRDTNPYGTIFGGVLLSYIDQAGAIGARHEMARNTFPAQDIVTVAMKSVEFHQSVFVGDCVSFWTELRGIGKTSITMHITVEADRDGELMKLTEADVTYVSVKTDGQTRKPVPIRGKK
ncbi:MAG: acyl-CoA thioesterase [Planctomycetaceae bacterium]|nr:acyl-CoA thioesterase [Planctomycetales bacterium]MCB9873749.1 acyl-CoA thioesterase [Planctomycetaceae bacterium]MCB9939760.1 acyl-CoA thioesterase [Planctomycetaceae bacterium]HRX78744.1 hotdog domain-containing protein [Pirellulaceae bacterium]